MILTIITEETEMISSMKIGLMIAGDITIIMEETTVGVENGAHLNPNKNYMILFYRAILGPITF
jgi:hypothetical protein